MMGMWVLSLLLPLTLVVSGVNLNQNRFRVTSNPGVARLFQVSNVNYLNQLQYAYNASTARELCESLGVSMATKEQVQNALDQGFETCRFGWIDEHFAVVPRIVASPACAQNMLGLRTWRASVTQKFDVFCFNSSGLEEQWEDSTTDSPSTTRRPEERSHPSSGTHVPVSLNIRPTTASHVDQSRSLALTLSGFPSSPRPDIVSSSTFLPPSWENSEEAVESMSSTQNAIGVVPKALLISFTCALLLTALVLLWYFKRNMIRSAFLCWEPKEKQEYIETKEWTCVKNKKEPHNELAEEPMMDPAGTSAAEAIEKDADTTQEP